MTISSFDITKDKNHNIEITNIRFTNEFINKNKVEYIDYIKNLLNHNYGIKYSEAIAENKLKTLSKDNYIYSTLKLDNNEYTEKEYNKYIKLVEDKFFTKSITSCD